MNWLVNAAGVAIAVTAGAGAGLFWQLLGQNGRILLRLEKLERQLKELDSDGEDETTGQSEPGQGSQNSELHGASNGEPPSSSPSDDERASRFKNRSLAKSRLKRDGLKAGTPAPNFRLPRLDGTGDFNLEEFRGRRVLLIFSNPRCGPCNALAPELQNFHRRQEDSSGPNLATINSSTGVQLVMISQGEVSEIRASAKGDGLTFPIVLQQSWRVSRQYATFATPTACLINESGIVAADMALGAHPILKLMGALSADDRNG